jgi:hypothetical protein
MMEDERFSSWNDVDDARETEQQVGSFEARWCAAEDLGSQEILKGTIAINSGIPATKHLTTIPC